MNANKKVAIREPSASTASPRPKSSARTNTSDDSMGSLSTEKDDTGLPMNADPAIMEEKIRRIDVLRGELAKMQERDSNAIERRKAHIKEEKRKAREKMHKEKVEKGITILPESAQSRGAVQHIFREETKVANTTKTHDLNAETVKMSLYIDHKLGLTDLPKGQELLDLAADFYRSDNIPNDHLPDHIRRELTTQEINDFRIVFDMFDAKNKGYITAEDLKRAAAMLGYAGKRKVFREMIDNTSKDKKGRVTFLNFLDLVVKLQGDGADPHEEIVQFFRLLDKENKGYVTSKDIRRAADELKVPLSNNAIREMVQEADTTGNGRITLEEFTQTMSQTGTFRAFVAPS